MIERDVAREASFPFCDWGSISLQRVGFTRNTVLSWTPWTISSYGWKIEPGAISLINSDIAILSEPSLSDIFVDLFHKLYLPPPPPASPASRLKSPLQVLGSTPRALYVVGRHPATELHAQSSPDLLALIVRHLLSFWDRVSLVSSGWITQAG